jgi:hypothetical protein
MSTGDLYREWAPSAASGSSPTYQRLALAVADDSFAREFLDSLEIAKRQPNLLFAAMRWHGAPVGRPANCLTWLEAHAEPVKATMLTHRTQTNEVARCAALLPALALLSGPISLIEVGASAGLCLLYDRWRYRYRSTEGETLVGPVGAPLTLTCETSGPVPIPAAVPRIVWRAGLDLNPIDLSDPDMRRWLECLIWPEHENRARALAVAMGAAMEDPPTVLRGDLLDDLPDLLDQAPRDTTIVVTHTATLTYVEPHKRDAFCQLLASRGIHRVGAEGLGVLADIDQQAPMDMDAAGEMILSIDQRAVASVHQHGRSIRWGSQ